ncbi:MAG: 2OG-Fe(II) oxygenase [Planctomycetales bacterium]|nr:2OG-Fe(II) oxygenase [Planctomycetales bacterium]
MTFLSPQAKVTAGSYPFNHLLIENVFTETLAANLSRLFCQLIRRAKPIGKVGEVGELIYDALNFTPLLEHVRSTAIAALASPGLRRFLASAFRLRLDENVMVGMHRHNPPSRPGWSHTDFAVVSFPNEPPNHQGLRWYYQGCNCHYSDDSRDRQPQAIKTARAIACLYYTANDPWVEGMGGETGLYSDLGKRLVGKIPPRNNSLFAFEISPISYHAYLGSETRQRNTYVWWYHAQPSYLLHRHRAASEYKLQHQLDPWDRWTDADVPKFETASLPTSQEAE